VNAVVADTHAAIWFYMDNPRLSATAEAAMDAAISAGSPVFLSPISLVEVISLIEKRRVPADTYPLLCDALDDPFFGLYLAPLDMGVAATMRLIPRADVPDMPEQIIAATALHLELPPISCDRKIKASAIDTIW